MNLMTKEKRVNDDEWHRTNSRPITPSEGAGAEPTSFKITTGPVMIQDRPSEMGSNSGPYHPSKILDLRHRAHIPADFAVFYSTDHSATDGGIYVSWCRGSPKVAANWKDHTAAVAAGWFDSIATKPLANPVLAKPGTNGQIETPWVIEGPDGTFVLIYQQMSPSDYSNQATMKATSPDLFNWTTSDLAWLKINQNPVYSVPGNGHTGYFASVPNPFSEPPASYYDIPDPATHIGRGLFGGSDASVAGWWKTSDPVNGPWRELQAYHRNRGRFTSDLMSAFVEKPGLSPAFIDLGSIRPASGGYSVLVTGRLVASGNDKPRGALYECLYDAYCLNLLKKPIHILGAKDTADLCAGYSATSFIDGEFITVFNGYYKPEQINRLYVIAGPIGNPMLTKFEEPSIPTPANISKKTADFVASGAGALTDGGLSVVTVGSPSIAYSTSANAGGRGASVTLNGSLTPKPEYYWADTVGFVPNEVEMAEVYVEDFRSGSTTALRTLLLAFAKDKAARSAQTDYIGLTNSTSKDIYKQVRKAGVDTSVINELYYPVGYNTTPGFRARHGLGIRWFPHRGKCFLLGEAHSELEEITVPNDWDLSMRLYPIFGVIATGTTSHIERVGKIYTRTAPRVSP